MFEGKLSGAAATKPLGRAAVAAERLRPVSWSDLVAKLEAARELRAELGAGETSADASFDPDSARHIAALAEGKQDINLDGLADGKVAGGISRSDKNGAASDDPRT
jgi:hypothetical protein